MLLFNEPTLKGYLLARRKRFFMDIELPSGEQIVAHTANTGSMHGLLEPKNEVLLTKNNDPKRSTRFSVQGIKINQAWVGVNTAVPNRLIRESLKHPELGFLAHYGELKAEVPYGPDLRSRVDFLLSESSLGERPCYLEIKNVTLKIGKFAQFPDAVSLRAQKHIDDLMLMKAQGFHACLIFVIQRDDCESFSPAHHIDKVYGQKLVEAVKNGLMVKALVARVSEQGIGISHEIGCGWQ
jgi:sugar fermentation stimulation protein A